MFTEEVGLTMTSGARVISEEGFPSQGTQTPAGGEVRVGEGLESKRETGQKSGAPGPAQWGSAPLGRGVTSTLASVMLEGKKKKKTAVWGLSQPQWALLLGAYRAGRPRERMVEPWRQSRFQNGHPHTFLGGTGSGPYGSHGHGQLPQAQSPKGTSLGAFLRPCSCCHLLSPQSAQAEGPVTAAAAATGLL